MGFLALPSLVYSQNFNWCYVDSRCEDKKTCSYGAKMYWFECPRTHGSYRQDYGQACNNDADCEDITPTTPAFVLITHTHTASNIQPFILILII